MYYDFYQLKENPFNITADPSFFYLSKIHNQAISNLIYGIEQRKGIIVITGEVGTGKTTLCRKLLKHTDKKTKAALILNPNFSELELLQMILLDLGVKVKNNSSKLDMIYALNKFLLKVSSKGYNVVIIIDEAQNLSTEQLEQIRLLSNLETEKYKLLQIILVGQPELDAKLQKPELRQLRQRIGVRFHIDPLDKADIKSYVYHRLTQVMQSHLKAHPLVFTERAIDAIFNFTLGAPRSINILCDRVLLAGFVAETYLIDEPLINDCAREVRLA